VTLLQMFMRDLADVDKTQSKAVACVVNHTVAGALLKEIQDLQCAANTNESNGANPGPAPDSQTGESSTVPKEGFAPLKSIGEVGEE
jgi:hypothetical protein